MNPWTLPEVAAQQRELVDRQLQEKPWPIHFTALAEAVRATECPGEILEWGSGSGYGREILDRAGVPCTRYAGIDISDAALAIARERYPESHWGKVAIGQADIVIDGSCVLHVDDWRAHLESLCRMSRRWVILHRLPITQTTEQSDTTAYGKVFAAWAFSEADVIAEMQRHGFQPVQAFQADGRALTYVFAKPRHYVTYCDRNYLGRLKALYASMRRHCAPFVLHVLAWDEDVLGWAGEQEYTSTDLGADFLARHPELDRLPGPPRTQIEKYWTVGPSFIVEIMGTLTRGDPVTYVDADIMFHSSPEPVFAEIGGAPAAVFPHNLAAAEDRLPGPTRETHGVFGRYNVGLVYVADRRFAEYWAEQCRDWCYDRVEAIERENGGPVPDPSRRLRYGDQQFLEDWVSMDQPHRLAGQRAHVVQHPGAELGPWAVHARALDVRDGVIHFGNRPLVAYHYSSLRELPDGFIPTRPEYQLTERQERIIYAPYYAALREGR